MADHKLTGSTFILVRPDKKVLLQKRTETDEEGRPIRYPGMWVFPGGTIEENEDSVTAATREIQEEFGIEVPAGSCKFLMNHELSYGNSADVFIVEIDPEEKDLVMSEGAGMKWVGIEEMKELRLGFEQENIIPEFQRFLEGSDEVNAELRRNK